MKIIISGGGTGGHIFPALATAQALKASLENVEILFVGANGKMEMEKVPQYGFSIEGLDIRGLQRSLKLSNLKVPFLLVKSLMKASRIVKDFKPDVVVGFGGYASGPVVYAAQRMGIPTVIQEQNSYAGVTNKLLAKKAKKICVAYEGMDKFFPKEKIVLTGNPVRKDLNKSIDKKEAHYHFDWAQNKKTLLLFGGSLGAKTLNEAMKNAEKLLRENTEIGVLWQVGKTKYSHYENCATAQLPNVKVLPFIDRMDMAYALADVIICRAGALTISELALVAKPAVLVPSPNVSEDHQTKNAMALVIKKAAKMIKDDSAQTELMAFCLDLLKNEEEQKSLSVELKKLARPDADDLIVKEIIKLV